MITDKKLKLYFYSWKKTATEDGEICNFTCICFKSSENCQLNSTFWLYNKFLYRLHRICWNWFTNYVYFIFTFSCFKNKNKAFSQRGICALSVCDHIYYYYVLHEFSLSFIEVCIHIIMAKIDSFQINWRIEVKLKYK